MKKKEIQKLLDFKLPSEKDHNTERGEYLNFERLQESQKHYKASTPELVDFKIRGPSSAGKHNRRGGMLGGLQN